VDKFYNMKTMSYDESASLIRADEIDIIFDMQVHTLGNRMQILESRPAAIQVLRLQPLPWFCLNVVHPIL
jgi:predicted O-linked N-acetylglucosamine transferase (SPINDLY family)